MKKKILITLLIVFIALQAFRPEKNSAVASADKDLTAQVAVPDSVMNILRTSCYDCHSNQTNYYWYHEIMPVGWWLNHHVEEGKEHLNFSEFSKYDIKKRNHKLEEIAEEIEEHKMPLESYTIFHEDAKLSKEQIQMLSDWAKSSMSR